MPRVRATRRRVRRARAETPSHQVHLDTGQGVHPGVPRSKHADAARV